MYQTSTQQVCLALYISFHPNALPRLQQSIITLHVLRKQMASEEVAMCDNCGNQIESCMCVCPYCGKKDACECCLYDAVTGG